MFKVDYFSKNVENNVYVYIVPQWHVKGTKFLTVNKARQNSLFYELISNVCMNLIMNQFKLKNQ